MLLRNVLLLLLTFHCVGCSTLNVFDRSSNSTSYHPVTPQAIRVARGKPNKVIDGVGDVLGVVNRLSIGDRRIDNHNISQQTENEIVHYLAVNGLDDTMLRVNQYNPIDEWKRMFTNPEIRPFWKATTGTYNLLKYTVLPGRLTGGDWYNPYSNTVNLYSDSAALGISKAAYAVDLRSRENRGAYAAIREVPLLGLKHDTEATQLAIDYYKQNRAEELDDAVATLYPSYGASWGSEIASFFPYGSLIGKVVGGVTGRIASQFSQPSATAGESALN